MKALLAVAAVLGEHKTVLVSVTTLHSLSSDSGLRDQPDPAAQCCGRPRKSCFKEAVLLVLSLCVCCRWITPWSDE